MKNVSLTKNLITKIFLALLVISVFTNTRAQLAASLNKTGTTSAQFLKIGVGSRAIGMGGAFTTMPGDLSSIYWNPAGLAQIYSRQATFNHVDWILDANLDHSAAAMHMNDIGTIGVFVSVLSVGDMLVRTIEQPEGTGEYFSSGAITAGLSYARNLTDNFAIGFNAKYVREYIWNESASSIAFDVGTLYRIPLLNEFRIGASISNFGPKMRLSGRDIMVITQVGSGEGNIINTTVELDQFDLPLMFRVGVAADLIKQSEHRFTTAIDAVHPNDNAESVNTGLEYSWNEIIFARAGMKALFEEGTEQGLTLGFGLNYRLIESVRVLLDYAYSDFGRLSNVHYLSVGLSF